MKSLVNILLAGIMGISSDLAFENTNICAYREEYHVTDLNRLRADLILEHKQLTNLFARLIIDNKSIAAEKPTTLQNTTKIYRSYLQYRGEKHFWSLGKQRIPLGVGRIWNPIDLFNPVNIQQIESDEREGSNSIRYEYALNDLTNFDATVAKDKGAVRLKGYLDYVDIALVGEWDNDKALDIVGWELEGELFNSGIELRSEGGLFHNRTDNRRYARYIIGAEYGFTNSLTLRAEYSRVGDRHRDYLGSQASYQPGMLWRLSLLTVYGFDDRSGFIAPGVEYCVGDEVTLSGGAFLYYGGDNSEFGPMSNRYYLRWFIHF